MIDEYERKHGPVEDRAIFDGEIVVPPHLRNMSLISNRFNGSLFGSLSRSRTFLNLTNNSRHTFHGSVPDLSRNLFANPIANNSPNDSGIGSRRVSSSTSSTITTITMNPSTKLALTNDSTALHHEQKQNGGHVISNDGNDSGCGMSDVSISMNGQMPKNENRSSHPVIDAAMNHNAPLTYRSLDRSMRALKPVVYTTKPSDFRNSRSQSMDANHHPSDAYMTLIQTNVPQASHSTYRSLNRSSPVRAISPLCTATSLHNINMMDSSQTLPLNTSTFKHPPSPLANNGQHTSYFGRSGFSGELSLNNLTKFTLPRVTLNHSTVNPNSN